MRGSGSDPGEPGVSAHPLTAPGVDRAAVSDADRVTGSSTDPGAADEATVAPAPTWHWVVASLASLIVMVGVLILLLAFIPTMAHEARHGARFGMLALEILPLVPPVLGGVIGGRTARGNAPATVWCFTALGALVGLAVVAVVLYGLVAVVAYLFVRDWQF